MAIAQIPAYQEFVDFITSNPSLEEMAEYRLTDATEAYISDLLHKNGEGIITPQELIELDEYLRLEHIMRMMKITAHAKLN